MRLAVTMGDASGVGPEILLRAWVNGEIDKQVLVYGDLAILEKAQEIMDCTVPCRAIESPDGELVDGLNVIDAGLLTADDLKPGVVDKKSGAAARHYIVQATADAVAGKHDGIVTLPMNKEATQLTDPNFCGHTELIAEGCGIENYSMMLTTPHVAVTHVSTHVSLQEAILRVKKDRIVDVIKLTHKTLSRFIENPRIAVAGLNPHAGENGLFGREDIEEIAPAVEAACALGINASGPHPADTVFHMAVNHDRFDAIVAMYHDQGHVPMKLIAFEDGVNVTIGLPIMRCSVDHGTAFDIAYKGIANTHNFKVAFEYGKKLVGDVAKA
ncbi:MAG: 4-hydroxythreonine-4-phosphate dehydrogenase PdxA [Planctomycetes bacterium]|nr:4-hydroxythreonine-4-phosphate dehydrogenase PdxA [Planctomycetota bacterium]